MQIPQEFPVWQAEVDIPVQAEVVQQSENIVFTDLGLTDERLEELFSQLDFGPPTVGVLPDDHGNIAHQQSSPLRVEQLEADSLPLPPAVRPWEGWIQ